VPDLDAPGIDSAPDLDAPGIVSAPDLDASGIDSAPDLDAPGIDSAPDAPDKSAVSKERTASVAAMDIDSVSRAAIRVRAERCSRIAESSRACAFKQRECMHEIS